MTITVMSRKKKYFRLPQFYSTGWYSLNTLFMSSPSRLPMWDTFLFAPKSEKIYSHICQNYAKALQSPNTSQMMKFTKFICYDDTTLTRNTFFYY